MSLDFNRSIVVHSGCIGIEFRSSVWLFPCNIRPLSRLYLKRESGGLQECILEGDGNTVTGPDAKRALGFGREADPMQGKDVIATDR